MCWAGAELYLVHLERVRINRIPHIHVNLFITLLQCFVSIVLGYHMLLKMGSPIYPPTHGCPFVHGLKLESHLRLFQVFKNSRFSIHLQPWYLKDVYDTSHSHKHMSVVKVLYHNDQASISNSTLYGQCIAQEYMQMSLRLPRLMGQCRLMKVD